jgi:hypothetical protein
MHPKVKEYLNKVAVIDGNKTIVGDVYVGDLNLTRLNFHDIHVTGDFYCSYNQLTTLEGCPTSVGGDFWCSINQLTTLEYLPLDIGGSVYIDSSCKPLLDTSYNAMLLIMKNGSDVFCWW